MPPGRKRVVSEPPQAQLFGVGKTCRKCRLEQDLEQFRIDKRWNCHHTICRTCERERVKAYAATKTPEEQSAMYRRWKEAQPPRRLLDNNIRSSYPNFSLEQAEAMLAAQEGQCAVCARELQHPLTPDSQLANTWRIDHCHSTGRIRGLLCQKCNTGIGIIGDTAQHLRAALAYLEAFEAKSNVVPLPSESVDTNVREAA